MYPLIFSQIMSRKQKILSKSQLFVMTSLKHCILSKYKSHSESNNFYQLMMSKANIDGMAVETEPSCQ